MSDQCVFPSASRDPEQKTVNNHDEERRRRLPRSRHFIVSRAHLKLSQASFQASNEEGGGGFMSKNKSIVVPTLKLFQASSDEPEVRPFL